MTVNAPLDEIDFFRDPKILPILQKFVREGALTFPDSVPQEQQELIRNAILNAKPRNAILNAKPNVGDER